MNRSFEIIQGRASKIQMHAYGNLKLSFIALVFLCTCFAESTFPQVFAHIGRPAIPREILTVSTFLRFYLLCLRSIGPIPNGFSAGGFSLLCITHESLHYKGWHFQGENLNDPILSKGRGNVVMQCNVMLCGSYQRVVVMWEAFNQHPSSSP